MKLVAPALSLPTFTLATRPAAASFTDKMIYVSDAASGSKLQISSGSAWVPDVDTSVVGLQVPTSVAYTTASLVTNARETGVVAMFKGWRIRRITTDRAARVRLYTSTAKRDTDAARPLATDPPDYPTTGAAPDHGCVFEVVTDATHLDLPVAPNVAGSELTNSNNIPITVDNLGATGTVTVTIYYQRIDP